MDITKKCSKCQQVKSVSGFSKDKQRKDGLRPNCRLCAKISMDAYRKTREGLASQIYSSQRGNSKQKGNAPPNYTKSEFKLWLFNQPNFEELFKNWVDSGYEKMMNPSCGRLDDYAPYIFDNLRITTWQVNFDKGCADRKAGINNKKSKTVNQLTKNGQLIAKHYSARQAQRDTGVHNGSISKCCNGKLKSAGGFSWSFA